MCINGTLVQWVIIRLPLPYKDGDRKYPGNSDEKIRCQAATYAWTQEKWPDVRVPFLWGFGFSDGSGVSHPTNCWPQMN